MSKPQKWQISVTIVLFALGIFLSIQFKTQQNLLDSLSTQKREDLVAMWKNLYEKKDKLEKEIQVLNREYSQLTQKASEGESNLSNIVSDMDKLRMVNGLLPAKGSGITITVNGSTPLLATDLIELLNELWTTGAEAVSINGYRILNTTAIEQIEDAYTYYTAINGERLTYPIVVTALGDPSTLEKGLTFTGGIIDNLNSFSIYPVIKQHQKLVIPECKAPKTFQYAKIKE
ncbi:DUF881 domain-containing protein [Bacillota bacterium LX-D]|nr:DUF881 domain-containing protein [Bacillota bacterium LX-D]